MGDPRSNSPSLEDTPPTPSTGLKSFKDVSSLDLDSPSSFRLSLTKHQTENHTTLKEFYAKEATPLEPSTKRPEKTLSKKNIAGRVANRKLKKQAAEVKWLRRLLKEEKGKNSKLQEGFIEERFQKLRSRELYRFSSSLSLQLEKKIEQLEKKIAQYENMMEQQAENVVELVERIEDIKEDYEGLMWGYKGKKDVLAIAFKRVRKAENRVRVLEAEIEMVRAVEWGSGCG